ncbi:MAG: hypothetical protein KF784_02030 [Fimbriimonadaceae bacterium]|nr:hypothetical protein [Fimbriimonadaceae bacterium]
MSLRRYRRIIQKGQTLIIALAVLAILLILGFIFAGIINRNIIQSARSQQRSVVDDLAEAGVRFAHSQMLYSASGADWRPTPTAPIDIPLTPGIEDPDNDYLQPGGPDGLGEYARVSFTQGRALIRVRYAPSDAYLFSTTQSGPLRNPGRARYFTIIESIGRYGAINPNDPTTVNIQDKRESRKLIAFASIGIIETARFVTDKDHTSRAAEFGIPNPLGASYEGAPVQPVQVMGNNQQVLLFSPTPGPFAPLAQPFGASLYCNTDVVIDGQLEANMNKTLGDGWYIAGKMRGADNSAFLRMNVSEWDAVGGNWITNTSTLSNAGVLSFDSTNPNFFTNSGILRDNADGNDQSGYPRSVGRKEPPSIQVTDPDNGSNRYHLLTADSGIIGPRGNDGRFGHGSGVYVNNFNDSQLGSDETARETQGSNNSLVYEWFNPPTATSGGGTTSWQGQYYIPPGAYVELLSDGFRITRNAAAPQAERHWRRPDGTDTGSSAIRYRIGTVGGVTYIINSFTPGVNINDPAPNFTLGRVFNGVLYFEGNIRIRGIIPTNRQLSIVSNGTIYIEGSITKGVDIGGARINQPSSSMLALMAKDYVAVNTTMFYGPKVANNVDPGRDLIRMNTGGGTISLAMDMLLDPNGPGTNPLNPSTWGLFSWGPNPDQGYRQFSNAANNTGLRLPANLIVSHTMEDGQAPYTFVGGDVNFGIGTPGNPTTYLWPIAPLSISNSASGIAGYNAGYIEPGYTQPNFAPIYGLGAEPWQRFAKFETIAFPIVPADNTLNYAYPFLSMTNNQGEGLYRLIAGTTNDIRFRHNAVAFGPTNNWLMSRAAVVPGDIRIEAAIYAEEGSFAVVPGNWFNVNPNDSRDAFNNAVAAYQGAPNNLPLAQAIQAAQQDRLTNYGSFPEAPFYGEPIDVRVQIIGSVSENMPLPMSYQAEWLRKWGWIPRQLGGSFNTPGNTPTLIPWSHVPSGFDITGPDLYVPNLTIAYDPALATASWAGFDNSVPNRYIRTDVYGRALPPMPRLPVGPKLVYFGEVRR